MQKDFVSELLDEPLSFVASKWILSRTPFIFGSDHHGYLQWKEVLSGIIGVDSCSITFTGSAATGFSLNPNKNLTNFNDESDVDLAIISQHFFEISWHHLRSLGALRYQLSPAQQRSVQDHRQRLIYWGAIATDRILEIFPFGKEWIPAFEKMALSEPTNGRDVRARIYKDFESLRAYQISNLNRIKNDQVDEILGD